MSSSGLGFRNGLGSRFRDQIPNRDSGKREKEIEREIEGVGMAGIESKPSRFENLAIDSVELAGFILMPQ